MSQEGCRSQWVRLLGLCSERCVSNLEYWREGIMGRHMDQSRSLCACWTAARYCAAAAPISFLASTIPTCTVSPGQPEPLGLVFSLLFSPGKTSLLSWVTHHSKFRVLGCWVASVLFHSSFFLLLLLFVVVCLTCQYGTCAHRKKSQQMLWHSVLSIFRAVFWLKITSRCDFSTCLCVSSF